MTNPASRRSFFSGDFNVVEPISSRTRSSKKKDKPQEITEPIKPKSKPKSNSRNNSGNNSGNNSRSKPKEPTKPITLKDFLDNVFPKSKRRQLKTMDIQSKIVDVAVMESRYMKSKYDFKLDVENDNPIINTEKNIKLLLTTLKYILSRNRKIYNENRLIYPKQYSKDFESTDLYKIYKELISVLENPKSKKYPQLFTEEELISYYYRPDGPYFEMMFDKYGHLFAKGTRKKKALKKRNSKKNTSKKNTRRQYKKR